MLSRSPSWKNLILFQGQFVTLDLPIHEKPNKRIRSYSIASWPDGTNVLELVIVLLEGGLGTTYLFNNIVVGSELTLRGPQGVFTLDEEDLQKGNNHDLHRDRNCSIPKHGYLH
jgi:CDP-4-dehydro-6-deoxyglucose reductase